MTHCSPSRFIAKVLDVVRHGERYILARSVVEGAERVQEGR